LNTEQKIREDTYDTEILLELLKKIEDLQDRVEKLEHQ